MPAINVARTDTFEQQRIKINQIGNQIFNVTAGGSDLSTGNLKLGDGTIPQPSLAFVSDSSLGIYKASSGTIGFVSSSKKLSDISSQSVKYYRDFLIEKNSLDTLFISIIDSGSNYDTGGYQDIPAIGGTGDGATLSITVDGFVGSITNIGSGYNSGTYQNIPLSGGSGTGAEFNFTVSDVSGIITNGGSGYVPGNYTSINLTGGTGTGLQANITVSDYQFDVTGGNNYPSGTFKSVSLTGGSGTGFKANLFVSGGSVQGFAGVFSSVLVSAGSGYQVGDTLTYNFPTGITQTFIVTAGGGKYYLDGVIANDFAMLRGNTYIFDASDASAANHPIFIGSVLNDNNSILGSADGITYELDGIVVTPQDYLANYTTSTTRIVTFVVPANPTNNPVYLNCSFHPNMAGSIDLVTATTGSNFTLEISELGGVISDVSVTNTGNGYTFGDVLGVNSADIGGSGSGFVFELSGSFGTIDEITNIPDFGNGYQIGDVLTLAPSVTNVSTYARGTLDFLGINLVSNAEVTSITYSGSAAGAATVYSNITPTVISGSGTGLVVTVTVTTPAGNPTYASVDIVNPGSGYRQGDQLRILGSVLGGADGGNDLNISVATIQPCNPQINIGDTTGVSPGDSVDVIQNVNNQGQIAGGSTVLSVDSASLITLDVAPPTPGTVDIRITNQNLTYLTVPDSSLIKVGFSVVKVSGSGEIFVGSSVSSIIDATTVAMGLQPQVSGPIVVNFEPAYGNGSNFSYTISDVGVVSDVSVIDGGNGYSPGDVLAVSNILLTTPIEYLVTNENITKTYFVSTSIPDTAIQVGDFVKDPGGNILSSTVTSSTSGPVDAVYNGVIPISTSGNGVGARFDISRGNTGEVLSANITIGYEGNFYQTGDTITLPGASVGGSTPADNIIITVSNVAAAGQDLLVYKAKSSGGFLQYIVTDPASFSSGDKLVNSAVPAVGYEVDFSENEFRYFIDLQDGNGPQFTPSWEMYVGNTYKFDLSDPSNGSHIFALSIFRDGQWDPSLFENIQTTVSTTSSQITIGSTTGILPGMAVEKVSGDGVLQTDTKVLSVNSGTTLTLDKSPTASGSIVVDIFGTEYTDGVIRETDSLTVRVTESTPTLYYFCDTDNATHLNEGGDDNEEAVITINQNNPRQFGSGFELLVTDVVKETTISGTVDGLFSAFEIQTSNITSTNADINVIVSDSIDTDTISTPILNSSSGFTATISGDTTFLTSNFKIGTTLLINGSTGDTSTSGYFSSNEYRVGNNLKLLDNPTDIATIKSYNGSDIRLVPDLGRLVDIDTTTALAIPVGDISSRPVAGIVRDGCIRFNTETNQYEGYSSSTSSWSSLGGVRDLDGNTYITAEETVGSNDNTLWFYNDNINTVKFAPTRLEFINQKTISSLNVNAPAFTVWTANTPVSIGSFLKYKNNLYEVTVSGTTATSGNEPTHTNGSVTNGTAELTWYSLAVAPLTFEDIEVLRIGPLGSLPVSINNDLRLANNTLSTDISDLVLRPNSGKKVIVDAPTSLVIPSGQDADRGIPIQGSIRFSQTSLQFEGYDGTNWGSLGGVKDVDQNTYIIPELSPGSNENILYFVNDNNNTIQLTTTALDFYSIDTIRSITTDELEITASLLTFDNGTSTFDNTAIDRTFLHTTKQYFDFGLSAGLTTDPVLRLDDVGDVYLNIGFGTGSLDLVKVFDGDLKEFELADVKILTEKLTLVKGTSDNGSSELYAIATNSGCKTTVIAENPTSGDKEFIEFGILDDGTDVFHTEYGNIRTGTQLIIPSFEVTGSNIVRINIELGASVNPTESVNITVVSNVTKK